jgi:hypothetical protein
LRSKLGAYSLGASSRNPGRYTRSIANLVFYWGTTMLDDEFNKQRAKILRELAEQADPFIKKRLLNLVERYETRRQSMPIDQRLASRGDSVDR